MLSTAILGISSFLLALLLTPLIRDLAIRWGLVDKPDQTRKLHKYAVPRIGGIPIVLACAGAYGVLLLLGMHGSINVQLPTSLFLAVLPAAVFVFMTGLFDDLIGLKPLQKLLGLTIASLIACSQGLQIQNLADFEIGWFGLPLTVLWLVGCANAFNLIDGVDGLAAGVGLLATLTMLAAGLLHGDTGLVIATVPLAGALFGFLRCNFNPASIFLGDCGSLLIGFLLGCYGVMWSQKSATLIGMTAPLMALSLPLLDTALSIARRYLGGRPIFDADHGHIHHRLLDRGFTPRRVTLLLYGASALAACLALVQTTMQSGAARIIVAMFCVAVWIGVRHLGYREFRIAASVIRRSNLRPIIQSQIALDSYGDALQAANTPEECWRVIRSAGREFGFSYAALRIGGRSFGEQLDTKPDRRWIVHVPLSDSDYVHLARRFDPDAPIAFPNLVDILHRVLSEKVVAFASGPHLLERKPSAVPTRGQEASALQKAV